MRCVLAIVVLGGCFDFTGDGAGETVPVESGVGDCPGGSTCSPKTPQGLAFDGSEPVLNLFPPNADTEHDHIVTGGVDVIELLENNAPFPLAFAAQVDDPAALVIQSSGASSVTLVGGIGTTELDIVDPATGLLFDRAAYGSSPLASAAAIPIDVIVSAPAWWSSTAPAFAFWPGDLDVAIALLDDGGANRLVDTSIVLALAGATQSTWQALAFPGATPGSYAIDVTSAGGATATAQLIVVDHADDLVALVTSGGFACFAAEAGGAFIVGIPWTYTIDGTAVAGDDNGLGPNCVFSPAGDQPFTVTASAGGQAITVDVTQ
jgi:hypothetical protein